MISLLQLIQESEQQDKQSRAKSQDLFRKLSNFVNTQPTSSYTKIETGAQKGALAFSASELDEQYGDLIIVFGIHKDQYAANFTTWNEGYAIVLSALDAPFAVKDIKKYIYNFRNVFVHEMAHYWNAKEWKGGKEDFTRSSKERGKMLKNLSGKDFDVEYVNNPMEFNAFYQEGLSKYTKLIKTYLQSGRKDLVAKNIPDNVQEFVKLVKTHLWPEFVKNLNPTYSKKLDKRISLFHARMKDFKNRVTK